MTLFDGEVEPARRARTTPPVGVVERDHDATRGKLSEYLDGSLPETDRSGVDDHLRYCRACRVFKATLDATVGAVNALPREPAPASSRQRLLEAVDRATEPEPVHPGE